ncbi:MAG: hypothetical protein CMO55_05510 [Verrucomicrobiales bacterium]|nr:hypothetical protein [Verrucomicrobiales bacterium]
MKLAQTPLFILTLLVLPVLTLKAEESITFSISPDTLTDLPSRWADYFGTHYTSSTEDAGTVWNTVRSFGGPHIGISIDANENAPVRTGPFTGKEIQFDLSDFHPPRGQPTAETLVPDLIEKNFTAIYLTTSIVRPSHEPFDKDRLYWAVRMIHEKHPSASEHIVWQIGNEVVSGHFDPKGVWKKRSREDRQPNQIKEDNFFGYDLAWKEDYYINDYLAPALEAIQRASNDVYNDPKRIQTALGSMNPYNKPNLVFLKNVMNAEFDGRQAPTLQGKKIADQIDYLTVHYMTGAPRSISTLQGYYEDYITTGKVKGVWITEDHGKGGRGPVTILDRSMRYLSWVASNTMNATQTRLCWWGENDRDPGGPGREAATLMGEFFQGSDIHFGHVPIGDGSAYLVSDGVDHKLTRMVVVLSNSREISHDPLKLDMALPSQAPTDWTIRGIQYSSTEPGKEFEPASTVSDQTIHIEMQRENPEPLILLIEAK